ncbi:hypothetical protein [Nocardia paucivorans]|uniref:hypothetical protein n=1 Tax=Nocardia paucivorans TaxID=114259 RepID=UPI0012FC8F79|nr:hypothetical protein [Nocardia paucivorans]
MRAASEPTTPEPPTIGTDDFSWGMAELYRRIDDRRTEELLRALVHAPQCLDAIARLVSVANLTALITDGVDPKPEWARPASGIGSVTPFCRPAAIWCPFEGVVPTLL